MTHVRRTLAAIDFSAASLAALDYALLLTSREPDAALHVVHALSLPSVPLGAGDALLTADFEQRVRAELEKTLHEATDARRGATPMEAHLVTGSPALAVVNEARSLACERIVVGATGRGPLARLLLGSVSERIVRTSPLDVLVTPAPTDGAPARTRIRNVVCATDFSAPAETALLRALALAQAHEAHLHVVHAWDVGPYAERLPELVGALEADVARQLDDAAHRHAARGVSMQRHLRRGPAAREILAVAAACDADLVVVGTTGKHGVDRLLLGSVAERVVRTSPVPVLVARGGTP